VNAREVLGEIVVVLEGNTEVEVVDDELIRAALRDQVDAGASTRDAVSFVGVCTNPFSSSLAPVLRSAKIRLYTAC